ncbi:SH3 domain-containing protein [Mameliella sediminis]|uniref:SH3 domain-containing protein n=1 Tax=Mameliella sediminis TaxID=2836866 RepID=UPI001C46FCD3|nr:SH3 domain-containing protein [Mameliella sediminis]MBV7397034.1 SH3 domain-containing protein [Mameliella sediminis]MBY6116281.1 SH3 domain-containing protein [Antarctobacter heliothermus]MBY6146246.1 SH3 domain-containing protein [Mameliella alba]MCA0955431.1 SH3 domain-containing protein [Mameliella alba]
MLRLLTFLSALFLATAAAASTLWVDAPRDGYLNLRSGPSTQHHVISRMPHGSKVELLRAPGKWVKVRDRSGSVGWAHSRFLSNQKPKKGHGGHADDQRKGTLYWVDAPRRGYAYLRNGPSRNDRVIDTMNHGDKLRVYAQEGDWYRVTYRGKHGWVNNRVLSRNQVNKGYGHDRTPDYGDKHAGTTYWVHAPGYGGLNMRSGPGTSYPVVMTMKQRDKVTELGRKGKWILLRHGSGHTGWAHGDYLTTRKPAPVSHNGTDYSDDRDHWRDRDGDRRRDHHREPTYNSFGDAIAACAGRSGQDLQFCVLNNLSRLK